MSAFRIQTSFTLMAASRTSAAPDTGCEGKDNIGRDERGERVNLRKKVAFHLKNTRLVR